MNRRLQDGVLKAFTKYTEDTEVPDIFSLWVGISMISSVLGRDCFIDFGHITIFPNMYIVLVAGSARCRKSTAIGFGRRFIEGVIPKVKITAQKMTPEALIGALSGMSAKSETTVVNEAGGVMIVDELSTLIDKNAFKTGLIPILTKLYDGEEFSYETRARGIEIVQNPCLSILGGSTTHWIREAIPTVAIGGGFTSRVVFIFKEDNEKISPWPEMTEENLKRKKDIAHDLNHIAKLRGSFGLTEDARVIFEKEYVRFKKGSKLYEDPNTSGYADRRHVTALKVAMVVSAAQRDDRVISADDIAVAFAALSSVENDMSRVLQSIRREFVGDVCEEVLTIIMNRRVVPRFELIKAMRYRLSAKDVTVIVETLEEERVIKTEREGNSIKYVYIGGKK